MPAVWSGVMQQQVCVQVIRLKRVQCSAIYTVRTVSNSSSLLLRCVRIELTNVLLLATALDSVSVR